MRNTETLVSMVERMKVCVPVMKEDSCYVKMLSSEKNAKLTEDFCLVPPSV